MIEKIFGNLVQKIEENYMTIDDAILEDLKQQNKEYEQVCRRGIEMENQYPFLQKLLIGQGKMILSAEEHKILKEYIGIFFRKDNMERGYIYFRGHIDGYAYLKKIGVIKEKKE